MNNSIDISKIIEMGDVYERAFFNWLYSNDIHWYQDGSNLNFIKLIDKNSDIEKIKNYWKEVVY